MAKGSKKKETETLHWADSIALEVEKRVQADPFLKKLVKERGYIVYDEKTPSGIIHIGSGRSWIMHDVIAKAMRDIGLKAKFILSSDDMDPFDKFPSYLDGKKYKKYLGMPFRNIPSPVKGYNSYAEYYFMQCVEKFEEYGIEAEIQSTGEVYESGKFNWAIKKVLDNADKVKNIFERTYEKPYTKLPFNVICEKCGKIGTTRVFEWDPKKEVVKYKCEPNLVDWAEGCSHEGEISPYDGNGKFPWKVEWAAKWPTIGVTCEFAGKDHFTQGGSRTIAIQISDEVFDFPPPYPSTRKYIGKGHEFFNVGGKKMSTSKGQGIGFAEATKFAPAKILRYLLVKTRPWATIDFNPVGKNDLILLYDRYDRSERFYFGKETDPNQHEVKKQKRIYELSHVGQIPDNMPPQISLSHAAIVIQVGLDEEGALNILEKTGHIAKDISGSDLHYVLERLHFAKQWVKEMAPEQYKFELQTKVPKGIKLTKEQKLVLKKVAEALFEKDFTEQSLHDEFYNLSKEAGLEPKEFFKAAYNVLIKKERGPKLANFILTIGKEKVAKMFDEIK